MLDADAIADARARDGDRAEDRPESVNQYLADIGEPEVDYQGSDNIFSPEAGEALAEAVEQAEDLDQLASAVGESPSRVKKSLRLHQLDAPNADAREERDRFQFPQGKSIHKNYVRAPVWEDSRVLEYLYVECGLGVGELVEVLSTERKTVLDAPPDSVSAHDVRGGLEAVGLIRAEEREHNEYGVDERFDVNLMHQDTPSTTIDASEL